MTNILEKIIEEKKQSLILTKKEKSFDVLEKNIKVQNFFNFKETICLLYTSPSPRDKTVSRMPSSA